MHKHESQFVKIFLNCIFLLTLSRDRDIIIIYLMISLFNEMMGRIKKPKNYKEGGHKRQTEHTETKGET